MGKAIVHSSLRPKKRKAKEATIRNNVIIFGKLRAPIDLSL
jgi:hypothetical protein